MLRKATLRSTIVLRPSLPLLLAWVLACALSAVPGARAEELSLVLDPETTQVAFHLKATGHDVEGSLFLQEGEIRFDTASGTASGEISVDATRADTGNKKRDKTMHGKVLESEQFPLMVFQPDRVEGTLNSAGESELQLHGTMRLHGDEHEMMLPVRVTREGAGHLTAHAEFAVPYVEWGLHNPSILFLRVADEVQVVVDANGNLGSAEETGHAR